MTSYPNLSNNNHPLPGMDLSSLNIFVFEEDHGIRDLLQSLPGSENLRVTTAASVTDGILQVQCVKPDILILVLDLPDLDGLDICRRFRHTSSAPILVLSSNGRPNFAEQVLDAGADDYLVKPVTTSLMAASLNKLTRRARVGREAPRFHDDPTL